MSEAEIQSITFNNVKFGEVTVDQRDVLEFPYGLPGFERLKTIWTHRVRGRGAIFPASFAG